MLDESLDNLWMTTAYRIPDNDCNCVVSRTTPAETKPIGRFKVRSFITSVADGAHVTSDRPLPLRGIAFDGGGGIRQVPIFIDNGSTRIDTKLG